MECVTMKEAKRMLLECLEVYLEKGENGYCIPQNKQRPVFIVGPAGIGKTELAKQIAEEKGIGFVSYSLTHHTRQSAIGLPALVEHSQDGKPYKATEYTMSEIVDSIYQAVNNGQKEGILFVDEINCVSETLSAVLLQFLQNKCFGPHRIPEGWVIVTAGNPPEYNKSVKTFDAVTYDRLRVIGIQPDAEAWMEYAAQACVLPVIIEYIKQNPSDFYQYEKNAEGIKIVTARGWEDLSNAMKSNERLGFAVDLPLIRQFIQCESIAGSFHNYYMLYQEILNSGIIPKILEKDDFETAVSEVQDIDFQRRWALITVLLQSIQSEAEPIVKQWKERTKADGELAMLETQINVWHQKIDHSLEFIRAAFGLGAEMDHYLTMLIRNKKSGYLLALKQNFFMQEIQRQMSRGSDSRDGLRTAINAYMQKGENHGR